MSYLFFIDESGQDHKQMPYEVRGGIAIPAKNVWAFSRELDKKEEDLFGVKLMDFEIEIKGENLLKKDIAKWALYRDEKTGKPYEFEEGVRRNLAKEFLKRGKAKKEFLRGEKSRFAEDNRKLQTEIRKFLSVTSYTFTSSKGRKKQEIEEEIVLREREIGLLKREMTLWNDQESLLDRNLHKQGRLHFAAYGQACLEFVSDIIYLLEKHRAFLLASVVPKKAFNQVNFKPDFLRKDINYLFERFYYLLEEKQETGILVMDQTELQNDRKFTEPIAKYFGNTTKGRERSKRITPIPLFVTQDITQLLGAADLCLYILNWGDRWNKERMTEAVRDDVLPFVEKTHNLQWHGKDPEGRECYSIFYTPDLY